MDIYAYAETESQEQHLDSYFVHFPALMIQHFRWPPSKNGSKSRFEFHLLGRDPHFVPKSQNSEPQPL